MGVPIITTVGLVAAAALVAARYFWLERRRAQENLQVRFAHHNLPRTIPRDVALCLYRIVQEALHNVIRPSGVLQAEVELTETMSHELQLASRFTDGRDSSACANASPITEHRRPRGTRPRHADRSHRSATTLRRGDANRMSRPRVILADDHTLLLEAFQKLLNDDCDIVGMVSDGRALLAATDSLRPDVVVVDISMPLLNGIDAARQIKQALPDTRIIFLTMNEDPDLAAAAFRAGASGYLLKRSAASELQTAIREVMRRRSYVTPLVTEGLMGSMLQGPESAHGAQQLTPRQREVVQLVAEGHSMKEVGHILNIAPRTVAFHKYRIMEQLKIRTTAELIQFAIKHHIV